MNRPLRSAPYLYACDHNRIVLQPR